jgi:hypothetical protein
MGGVSGKGATSSFKKPQAWKKSVRLVLSFIVWERRLMMS